MVGSISHDKYVPYLAEAVNGLDAVAVVSVTDAVLRISGQALAVDHADDLRVIRGHTYVMLFLTFLTP